jgi:hypothetical protein
MLTYPSGTDKKQYQQYNNNTDDCQPVYKPGSYHSYISGNFKTFKA